MSLYIEAIYLHLFTTPIAIIISILALRGFYKMRNWRLLFLAVAFLLLSLPYLFDSVLFLGSFSFISSWSASELDYAFLLLSMESVVPFGLLAYVYVDEVRKNSIKITRVEYSFAIGLILVGCAILASQSFFWSGLGWGISDAYPWPFFLIYSIFLIISYVMLILIILCQYSFFRAKRTKGTLVIMSGFICLLFSQGYGPMFYIMTNMDRAGLGFMSATLLELTGYLLFLFALLRLRFFK